MAVLDVRLADGDGVEVCREIRSRHPEVNCLMLASFADDEALFAAIMAGAAGYVRKAVRGADLIGARRILELIAAGRINRQIAETIFLAEKTVKNYVSDLLAELGMSRRSEAADAAQAPSYLWDARTRGMSGSPRNSLFPPHPSWGTMTAWPARLIPPTR